MNQFFGQLKGMVSRPKNIKNLNHIIQQAWEQAIDENIDSWETGLEKVDSGKADWAVVHWRFQLGNKQMILPTKGDVILGFVLTDAQRALLELRVGYVTFPDLELVYNRPMPAVGGQLPLFPINLQWLNTVVSATKPVTIDVLALVLPQAMRSELVLTKFTMDVDDIPLSVPVFVDLLTPLSLVYAFGFLYLKQMDGNLWGHIPFDRNMSLSDMRHVLATQCQNVSRLKMPTYQELSARPRARCLKIQQDLISAACCPGRLLQIQDIHEMQNLMYDIGS